jgi:predicted nucleic acid-binding protein
MTPLVVDASAAVDWLLRSDVAGRIDAIVARHDCAAPEVFDVEVLNTLRRKERLGEVNTESSRWAVEDLAVAPIARWPHRPFFDAAWQLRHDLSAYDAMYVALARVLDCALLTTDRRLATTPDLGITVTVLA